MVANKFSLTLSLRHQSQKCRYDLTYIRTSHEFKTVICRSQSATFKFVKILNFRIFYENLKFRQNLTSTQHSQQMPANSSIHVVKWCSLPNFVERNLVDLFLYNTMEKSVIYNCEFFGVACALGLGHREGGGQVNRPGSDATARRCIIHELKGRRIASHVDATCLSIIMRYMPESYSTGQHGVGAVSMQMYCRNFQSQAPSHQSPARRVSVEPNPDRTNRKAISTADAYRGRRRPLLVWQKKRRWTESPTANFFIVIAYQGYQYYSLTRRYRGKQPSRQKPDVLTLLPIFFLFMFALFTFALV